MKIRRPFRAAVYVAVIVAGVGYLGSSGFRASRTQGTVVASIDNLQLSRVLYPEVQYDRPDVFLVEQVDEGWRICGTSAQSPVLVIVSNVGRRWGLVHHVVEVIPCDISIWRRWDHHPPVPIQDQTVCLRILQDLNKAVPAQVPSDIVAAYSKGEDSTRRILWLGVLGDLSILAAFAAIIFSLVKLRREIMWRKPGHCTECGYDLVGLSAEKCPECGAAINSATTA